MGCGEHTNWRVRLDSEKTRKRRDRKYKIREKKLNEMNQKYE